MREENFWCKKPRYSEVRVIARRVIARYDSKIATCINKIAINKNSLDRATMKISGPRGSDPQKSGVNSK